MNDKTKYILDEADLPKVWYNINPDMPISPGPVLHPVTKEPATPDFLSVLFPMRFIQEAASTTSTKVYHPLDPTSPTLLSPRHFTHPKRGPPASPPRLVLDSGARPWPWLASFSIWLVTSIW